MKLKEIANIEKSFFDVDDEAKVARITLEFERAEDIFDENYISKTPVLSDDFIDWIGSVFTLVSDKYKIDLTVNFKDMGGYTEDNLSDIFRKNIELELKSRFKENRKRNRVAYGLIFVGVMFFFAMMLINRLWDTESVWKEIFVYISDIATTVTFWEAMTILVVEQKEKRAYIKNLRSRFSSIRFASNINTDQ